MTHRRKPRRDGTASVIWRCRSPRETEHVGRAIARCLQGGEVLALRGDLGSGKTTLIRGLAEGLGASRRSVRSPTFVFLHVYQGRLRLAHVDLYRLNDTARIETLGLDEYLDGRTVVAIEWAEYAASSLPADHLDIALEHRTPTERRLAVRATGTRSGALLADLRRHRALGTGGRRSRTRP